jgi:sugar phosphate isomerase/epimerase
MRASRRDFLAGLAASAFAQEPPERAKPRSRPIICLYSKYLVKLRYWELGGVLQAIGFEGCDLAIHAGGHVLPELSPVDLLRAIESLQADGVSVPMVTTAITSLNQPWAQNVLAICGGMGVPLFRPGYWRYGGASNTEARLMQVRRDLGGLMLLGRACKMAVGVHNRSGDYVGSGISDTDSLIQDLDPQWIGYCFDPCHATAEKAAGAWSAALKTALPRLKMVAVQDFQWAKEDGESQMKMCPLGEGIVEWPKVFAMLAQARFTGPLSLHLEYSPANELAAISKDLEFLKKQIDAAYGPLT